MLFLRISVSWLKDKSRGYFFVLIFLIIKVEVLVCFKFLNVIDLRSRFVVFRLLCEIVYFKGEIVVQSIIIVVIIVVQSIRAKNSYQVIIHDIVLHYVEYN